MNLSIIIPNYNGEKLLQKNLPKILDAVKDYKNGKVEIIIPDDCSTDGSRNVIEKFIEEAGKENVTAKTIENKNKKESGFSKNVNRGAKVASGDILILLNTDVTPRKDFLEHLLKHFEDPRVFAVGCMDESIEYEKIVLRGAGMGSFKRGFLVHRKGDVKDSGTLWVSGGSGAFRKETWDRLKGFDVLFNPFYWEDIDLSYRAIKSGYKIVFEPKSVVVHEHEKGSINKEFDKKYIKKIAYRNQFIFMWKNITDPALLLSHIIWMPYHFLKALFSGDWQLFSGFLQAFSLFGKIIQVRKSAGKLFIKKDIEVIKPYV